MKRAARRIFLSAELATSRTGWIALIAALVPAAIFAGAVPFAARPLEPVLSFIPAHQSAIVAFHLVTAALLLGLYQTMRARPVMVLACGYIFSATVALAHLLTFPGVFTPAGLLGGGPQSTAWLHVLWHGAFPLFVLAYAYWRDQGLDTTGIFRVDGLGRRSVGWTIAACAAASAAGAAGLVLLVTALHDILPVLVVDGRFTRTQTLVILGVWPLSLLAFGALWRRRPHTVLDQWLMVVMCVWMLGTALSAVFNGARFDLGWYAGRVYGMLASSLLLGMLLFENAAHYTRLVQLSVELGAANQALERMSRHDALTDLANRRYFDEYLAAQLAVARRQRLPLALALFDVDHFKQYNDRHGHQTGDECLKAIAQALRSCCRRPADLAARYGGEEFAMILPDTDLADAARIAETVREAVAGLSRSLAEPWAAFDLSISGGVSVQPARGDLGAAGIIAAADKALFRAKHAGRNRIAITPAEPSHAAARVA